MSFLNLKPEELLKLREFSRSLEARDLRVIEISDRHGQLVATVSEPPPGKRAAVETLIRLSRGILDVVSKIPIPFKVTAAEHETIVSTLVSLRAAIDAGLVVKDPNSVGDSARNVIASQAKGVKSE